MKLERRWNARKLVALQKCLGMSLSTKAILQRRSFFNRKEDIIGLLKILWHEEWLDEFAQADIKRMEAGTINPYSAILDLETFDLRRRIALSPAMPGRMMRAAVTPEGEVDIVSCRCTLLVVTGQVLLRRTYGTQIPDRNGNMPIEVGSSIPPYTITAVELRMTSGERHEHHTFFRVLAADFDRKRKAFQSQQGERVMRRTSSGSLGASGGE